MRSKKNLSSKTEAIIKRHEKVIPLPPLNSEFLSHVKNLGSTKSWVRETSRCKGTEDKLRLLFPQLHHLDDSPYNPSVSNLYLQQLVIDTCTSRILPSRNAKIPSKFAPVSFVPVKSIAYCINPSATRLELSGVASPTLLLYHLNQVKKSRWVSYECTLTRYECNIIDPFDAKKKCMQFTSIIKFEGIVFALSLQGALVVMQEMDSRLTITAISSSRAVPSLNPRFFKEFLVDLNGDILLVFLIHEKTVEVVDKVEVYRLCFPDLKWIKVERIQGKTLFLERGDRVWVNSTEIGGRGDCIYFTEGSNNCWWKYDMERDCILPSNLMINPV